MFFSSLHVFRVLMYNAGVDVWLKLHAQMIVVIHGLNRMFKIEVFNVLQTRFGASQYTSLKTTLRNATPN